MTCLVTGAAGFIASRVAKRLLDDGHRVVGIDNLNDYYATELKRHRLDSLRHEQFRFHETDIENRQALTQIFDENRFDVVFNLAARAGGWYEDNKPWSQQIKLP
ncbi:UDP-glucose 4-epimerase [Stieleria neptunia]|uniref:UDP-glucose 4-epimerase n=1 Tax=Stieleria neptunia TaxID=2527979 RepID=A0A518HN94_9BACT|nr:NAD-dependent epimerase/dehydratase family protein [Stieleria neptunia]QDV42290.1 UDP-glucose 4-epimerase [Stieleria neptunia]